jgi:hypothetical protein
MTALPVARLLTEMTPASTQAAAAGRSGAGLGDRND